MAIVYEDMVLIKYAEKEGDNTLITISCPDKIGLGCDLCRVLFQFGLTIDKADFSTDGRWCYLVFWVVGKQTTRWSLLKERMLNVCPICLPELSKIYYYKSQFEKPTSSNLFLLKFFLNNDQSTLLHDVTKVLNELELTIRRVKVSTTPEERIVNLFFVIDTRDELHTKKRQDETISLLNDTIGVDMITCEIKPVGAEVSTSNSFIPREEEMYSLFCLPNEIEKNDVGLFVSSPVSITLDNTLSPSHSRIQIVCQNRKGLVYDVMRTLKDNNIKVCHGRFFTKVNCEFDLLVMRIVDEDKQNELCSRLRMELLCPLRMETMRRGPNNNTELIVVNPVEVLSNRGRPLVFHDITHGLKSLDVGIFWVEIVRHRIHDQEWEVYKILLDDHDDDGDEDIPFSRNVIEDCVRKKLMSWE
ncbi:ACT domain-containing protein ACR10-like [Impatiens glandulifera]|uniref:ACT domain-containing protein ACR10-like n=1 Tax=Impatiens glandulifera TaxID=253017 RepID=UPI001FB0ADA2|nr:ACT domain-containing protein ACR10-like [Impatiens glandulifera]